MGTAPSSAPPPPRLPPPPRQSAPGPVAPRSVPKLGLLTRGKIVPKLLIMGTEGWGKTSFLAHMPKPAILMARGEAGYKTLLDAGRVPQIPAVSIEDWSSLLAILDDFIATPQLPFQTLGLDAVGGFQRLCHEFVCRRDFGGDWGEKGFMSFRKGAELSGGDWLQMLARLERLQERGVTIVLLSHVQVTSFKNPQGADFDRYSSDLDPKYIYPATAKWADAILFGQFISIVDEVKKGKGKGIGGTERVLYTERRDAFDAKNRYGMPEELAIPADPTSAWTIVSQYLTTTNPA